MSKTDIAIIRCANCLVLNRIPVDKLEGKSTCGSCKAVLQFPHQPLWAKSESFDFSVANWPETLLVVFTAPLCLYCKIIDPVIVDLARDRAGKLKVMKVDIEGDTILAGRFKITKTPTFVVFKNGTELIRVDGSPKEKTELVKWIDNLINFTSY